VDDGINSEIQFVKKEELPSLVYVRKIELELLNLKTGIEVAKIEHRACSISKPKV
jgi:hypothetical protein